VFELIVQKIGKKIRKIPAMYAQILVVWVVFSLMVLSSYYFMSGIESRHLRQHINDFLAIITARIEFEVLETDITLRNISLVLRKMILSGASHDMVLDYMAEVSNFVLPYEKHMMETTGIYGYFDAFGGAYLDGLGWEPPDDYNPLDRPWYTAAVAANGDIANTELYIDMDTRQMVTTCAQRFFDDEGRPLGIICLDISLDNVANYIISTRVAGSGYGMLLDENRIIVVHPNADYLGREIYEISGSHEIINDLDHGETFVSEREMKNYEGIPVITFFHKLDNGWYLGIIIPKNNYYQSLNTIARILIVLGVVLAGILSLILLHIIREKQKADEQVRNMMKKFEANAHWYKSILDAIPLPITVTDANTNWTFVNTQVEIFLGVKLEDIKGKPCSNWGAHICNTPNCGIECAKRGLKHTYFTQNGASYKVDVEILKDINGETAGYIEVVQDITQMETMAKRQMEAETISKAKSAFLATMSHEIRTPLNAIIGITDIQIQDQTLSQSTREALIKICNSGDMLLHIINDILDLSKIEAGKLELVPVNYDVPSLINDTISLNIPRISIKPIEFQLNINENVPLEMFGDELRIKQILNNLLSNAFKYTDRGKVTLLVDLEKKKGDEDRNVILIFKVSDTGHGMTQEEISNMFNEYSRFNMETNRTTEGTGLGMGITKHLIRLMSGEIYVESEPGKGSAFTVRLPQKEGDSGIIGKELAENLQRFHFDKLPLMRKTEITREPMPYGHVLIVDDVETNLYVAKGLMTPYDLKIDLAMSGYEAIEKIKEGNIYDIIFMDHMMPKMDGVEAAKLIRDMGYTQPIVALTANAVVGQAEMFMENGFDGFIPKPIDLRQLNVMLNKLIRNKQPQEVIEKAWHEKAEKDRYIRGSTQQSIGPELAGIFARDAEKAISTLETILQKNFHSEDDIQLFIINVHAMKSALANIGEAELSNAALRLEQAGREKDIIMMSSKTNDFLDSLRMVIKKLKPADDENESSEDSRDALDYLREKLAVIHKACVSFDKKTIKDTLSELKEKTWSHDTKEMINKIAEYLLHSEFDNAAALADEYIKKF
jgi:PAS domain S-box-containing protein